jgi:uncharacterized protein YndB with AHSA1/START domain
MAFAERTRRRPEAKGATPDDILHAAPMNFGGLCRHDDRTELLRGRTRVESARISERQREKEGRNMVDILHRIGIKGSSLENVYQALATREGLAAWWTNDTQGESRLDGVLQFRFEKGGFDMKVLELRPEERVVWRVVDGPPEWIGTKVVWDVKREGDHIIVLFKHEGWKEPGEMMHHCSTKWAVFLLSLKSLLETGKGAPEPHDLKIDNWN